MSIDITWETESGKILEQLDDLNNDVVKIIENNPTENSTCLTFIDPYGDTTFNQLQIPILKTELESVLRNKLTEETLKFLDELILLCDKCMGEVHTYIKFNGD